MSLKAAKKLAKANEPLFLAVVRSISLKPSKRMKTNSSVLAAAHAQEMIEGEKRKQRMLKGPKKDFKSVQKREQELIQSGDPSYNLQLQTLVKDFRDVFPKTLPKGRPQKGT